MSSFGLLVLRLALGAIFIVHGLDKFDAIEVTQESFQALDIPFHDPMAYFIAGLEVIGGGMLILGLLTPLAGFLLAINMAVAGVLVHRDAFLVANNGFEFVLILGAASLALALVGPGRFSLDAAFGIPPARKNDPTT